MATYKTYDTVGIREDLQNAIYDISPTTTPFMSTLVKQLQRILTTNGKPIH